MKSEGIRCPDMVADVLEMHPRRHSRQPRTDLSDGSICPERITALFVDVLVVGWGNDTAVFMGRPARYRVRFQSVKPDRIMGAVGFAQTVAEVDDGTLLKRGF